MTIKKAYMILGVAEGQSFESIRKKYLHLVKKYHPDACTLSNSKEKIQELNDAYQMIKLNICTKDSTAFCNENFSSPYHKHEEKEVLKKIQLLNITFEETVKEYKKDIYFGHLTFIKWLDLMILIEPYAKKLGMTRKGLIIEYKNDIFFGNLPIDVWVNKMLLLDSYAEKLKTTRKQLMKDYREDIFFGNLPIDVWVNKMLLLDSYAEKLKTTRKQLMKDYREDIFFGNVPIDVWAKIMMKIEEQAMKMKRTNTENLSFSPYFREISKIESIQTLEDIKKALQREKEDILNLRTDFFIPKKR